MNLISLLLSTLTSGSVLSALTGKTGSNESQMKKLLVAAIPLLIKYMTKNASSTSGAQSLLSALTGHTSTKSMADQVAEVDEVDGAKILGHILGSDQKQVFTELTQESGMSEEQVSKSLSSIAPALLSGLSAATQSSKTSGNDLTDLLSTFSGAAGAASATAGLADLASFVTNGGVQAALNGQQVDANAASSGLMSMISGLFGGTQKQEAQDTSEIDGTALLSALTSLMQ